MNDGTVAWTDWRVACFATRGDVAFVGFSGGSRPWNPGQAASVIVNVRPGPHGGGSGTLETYAYRCILNVEARDISESATSAAVQIPKLLGVQHQGLVGALEIVGTAAASW